MQQSRHSRYLITALCAALSLAAAPAGDADGTAPVTSGAPLDVYNNFGFPMGFDVAKMDLSADPRQDFARFANGRWLDVATLPGDSAQLDGIGLLSRQVDRQVGVLLEEAAAASVTAPKGSPLQQVGDLYAAGMDVGRLQALGTTPLQPVWDRIARIDGRKALAEEIARLSLLTNQPVMFGVTVSLGLTDPTKVVVFAEDGALPLPVPEYYLAAESAHLREVYRDTVANTLALAGVPADQARARAAKILEMETRVASKKLTAVQDRDFGNAYREMPYADFKSLLGNVDLDSMYATLGLPTGGPVLVHQVPALQERNQMLRDYPLEDIKAYLQWEALRLTLPYLSPQLNDAQTPLVRALTGQAEGTKREKDVARAIRHGAGHSLSRLYVERYLPAETRADVEALVTSVRAELRERLVQNPWLTAPTRDYALQKFDRIKVIVGYPDQWIDYSGVDIRRDDFFGSMTRLNEFSARRALARFGQPPQRDLFDDPEHTLPIIVNAAYSPDRNDIEIAAAILQPPFYDHKADPVVNYCTLGAAIGHEFTHSLDSMGRLFDASGALRDWWAPVDIAAFNARSKNLIDQANAYQVLPGVHLNGELSSGENLADIGGLDLAYSALQKHLQAHPEANRTVDGFTPSQRCYLAWAQMWAEKIQPELLRQYAATDPHPPGAYRASMPMRNAQSFHDAFGVRPGDKMWLDPQKRVTMW